VQAAVQLADGKKQTARSRQKDLVDGIVLQNVCNGTAISKPK
jgi:hypothetical protein